MCYFHFTPSTLDTIGIGLVINVLKKVEGSIKLVYALTYLYLSKVR